MKIKKVDDKPMVIHTKEKAKIHSHEPKKAKIKGSNIYTVQRGPKIAGANDGKQTPMRGHPVFIAQHATATCCRECIRKWHKMQPGKELSQVQQDYLVDVIMTWIQKEIERQEHKI